MRTSRRGEEKDQKEEEETGRRQGQVCGKRMSRR